MALIGNQIIVLLHGNQDDAGFVVTGDRDGLAGDDLIEHIGGRLLQLGGRDGGQFLYTGAGLIVSSVDFVHLRQNSYFSYFVKYRPKKRWGPLSPSRKKVHPGRARAQRSRVSQGGLLEEAACFEVVQAAGGVN